MPFRVALTFDAEHPDRPTESGVAEAILDCLEAAKVRATFFVQGRWAEAYPETARRIAPAGHLVGSHSHYHARMPLFSGDGLVADVQAAEDVIGDVLGLDPRPWFRCPFGAGHDDPEVVAGLAALGYQDVGWNVIPFDWERLAREVENAVVDGSIANGDESVVLLHTWPAATIGALPGIIRRLTEAGASFVRLDELDSLPTGTPG
jgi:peptidoglycan/xylan/chitin deacetylase (PgdA/CDA1 family)